MICDLCGVERDLEHVCIDALKAERDRLLLKYRQAEKMASVLLDYIHALKNHPGQINSCKAEPCLATIEFLKKDTRGCDCGLPVTEALHICRPPTKFPEKKSLTCDDCGAMTPDVEETTCPYNSEINEKEVEITVCEKCYQERLYDI